MFCSLTLLVGGEKNILPNLTNSQEPQPFFLPLGDGAARKKLPGAGVGVAWEKNQEPGPLKKSQEPEPEPEPLKNCRLPIPCLLSKNVLEVIVM